MSAIDLTDVLIEHTYCGDRYCGSTSAAYRSRKCTDCADVIEAQRTAVLAWLGERLAGARGDWNSGVRAAVAGAMVEYGPDGHVDGYQEIADAALAAVAEALGVTAPPTVVTDASEATTEASEATGAALGVDAARVAGGAA